MRLYRQRYIPCETVMLSDEILFTSADVVVTRWKSIRPRKDALRRGLSCYFIDKNVKVSAFFGENNEFLYWYCDIILTEKMPDGLLFRDLLADVLVLPDGFVKVLDLDELADARKQELITRAECDIALRTTNFLLTEIYEGRFGEFTNVLSRYIES